MDLVLKGWLSLQVVGGSFPIVSLPLFLGSDSE